MNTQTKDPEHAESLALIPIHRIRISRQGTHELLATSPSGIRETTQGEIHAYRCEVEEGEELTAEDIVSIAANGIALQQWMRLDRIIHNFQESPIYVFLPALRAQGIQFKERQPHSDLEPVLSDVPWGSSYAEGAGIDAVTGNVMGASALKPFHLSAGNSFESEESLDSILNFSSLEQKMEASTKGSYNIEGVSVNESTKYLNEIRQSALAITYIADYRVRGSDYDGAPNEGYELNTEAKALIQKDPAAFRKQYGDYFVASQMGGSSFRAVYALEAKSSSDLTSFESSAGVSVEGLFSKEGSAKFESAAASLGIQVRVHVQMIGFKDVANQPSVTSPTDVPGALAWFKQHQVAIPRVAKLIHYSALDPAYPRRVAVGPETFVELRQLYTLLWEIRAMYHSLPQYYAQQLSQSFIALDAGIPANQTSLPTNQKMRNDYRDQAQVLWNELSQIRTRQAFYDKLRGINEPKQGVKQQERRDSNVCTYGATTSPDPGSIQMYVLSTHARDSAPGAGSRTATLSFGPDSQHIVAGWEVVANWRDGPMGSGKKPPRETSSQTTQPCMSTGSSTAVLTGPSTTTTSTQNHTATLTS